MIWTPLTVYLALNFAIHNYYILLIDFFFQCDSNYVPKKHIENIYKETEKKSLEY